jgi:hypothetical protein
MLLSSRLRLLVLLEAVDTRWMLLRDSCRFLRLRRPLLLSLTAQCRKIIWPEISRRRSIPCALRARWIPC